MESEKTEPRAETDDRVRGSLADGRGRAGDDPLPTRPVKRSFTIAGHRTSISLETAFWDALREIAEQEHRSLASLVAEIDKNRGNAGLSGAVRIWVLDHYRRRAN